MQNKKEATACPEDISGYPYPSAELSHMLTRSVAPSVLFPWLPILGLQKPKMLEVFGVEELEV